MNLELDAEKFPPLSFNSTAPRLAWALLLYLRYLFPYVSFVRGCLRKAAEPLYDINTPGFGRGYFQIWTVLLVFSGLHAEVSVYKTVEVAVHNSVYISVFKSGAVVFGQGVRHEYV